jgi:peptidoglycan/xylan/chitin deacetylase (PgdA/CDA1 family)
MIQVLLTFDTEDFIGENSISILHRLLLSLKELDLKALFFVTGYMAEKIKACSEITHLLEEHVIGYHSSSHSVHPTIFEFTDIANYEKAYKISLIRETSNVNPLNGRIIGKGGILSVRSLCKKTDVLAYRAPGFCWSPPHTEALRDLGIKFDFSTNIAVFPVFYKGLTFYPFPTLREWSGRLGTHYYHLFISSVLRKKMVVICLHPNWFVSGDTWDSIYHKGNPQRIKRPSLRSSCEFKSIFRSFTLFLKRAKHMENIGLIEINPNLRKSDTVFSVNKEGIENIYEHSMRWPKQFFGYKPKYLREHFYEFFNNPANSKLTKPQIKKI